MAPVTSGGSPWHDRPRLRPDLKAELRRLEGREAVVAEDEVSGAFVSFEPPAWAFALSLDGRRTLEDALATFNAGRAGDPLPPEAAIALVQHLRWHGLLADQPGQGGRQGWSPLHWGPLVVRLSTGNPDRFFTWLHRRLGFATSPWALAFVAAAVVVLTLGILGDWSRFVAASRAAVTRDGVLWLVLAWVMTKLVHESAHGLVVKRYGGEVRDAGILFVLFVPLGGYVDASSAWRFRSRLARVHVSLAGVAAELMLAALALAIWQHTPEGDLNEIAHAIVLMVLIGTLVFNANPLMRFDGYYVLSDVLDRPNLATRGQSAVAATVRRWLGVGGGVAEPVDVKLYGWLAFAWRWFVLLTLITLAADLFFGFGIVLSLAAALSLVVVPAARFAAETWRQAAGGRAPLLRRSAAVLVLSGAVAAAPVPQRPSAPGIVDFDETTVVRARTDGRVSTVHVENGDVVAADDLVARLTNPDLDAELAGLRARLAIAEALARRARRAGLTADAGDAAAQAAVLRERRDEARARQRALEIHAPISGRVLSKRAPELEGQWLRAGDAVVEIGEGPELVVRAFVDSNQEGAFRANLAEEVRFVPEAPERRVRPGRLRTMEPRAAKTIPEALRADAGGPIAMRAAADGAVSLRSLVEAKVTLDRAGALVPGELGVVRLPMTTTSLAARLRRFLAEIEPPLDAR